MGWMVDFELEMRFDGCGCNEWARWVRKKGVFLNVFKRFLAFIFKNIDLYRFFTKNTRFFAPLFSDLPPSLLIAHKPLTDVSFC